MKSLTQLIAEVEQNVNLAVSNRSKNLQSDIEHSSPNTTLTNSQEQEMKISELKNSKFLTQHECEPAILATIKHVSREKVGTDEDSEEKSIVHFREDHKPLVLNYGNAESIYEINGSDDTDDWGGTVIVLYRDPNVMFGGKRTGGIRIRAPRNQPQKPVVREPAQDLTDEDIPF